jgi:hypothetical protein
VSLTLLGRLQEVEQNSCNSRQLEKWDKIAKDLSGDLGCSQHQRKKYREAGKLAKI